MLAFYCQRQLHFGRIRHAPIDISSAPDDFAVPSPAISIEFSAPKRDFRLSFFLWLCIRSGLSEDVNRNYLFAPRKIQARFTSFRWLVGGCRHVLVFSAASSMPMMTLALAF